MSHAHTLVDEAVHASGRDNTTAVVIEILRQPAPAATPL
jgi:serine/threonine protein phosphatase PrpC